MKRFYNIRKLENLTGHLTIGLAPHTSAGSLSRIIGFTDAQVCYAHPFYHAAKRRNADGDEDGAGVRLVFKGEAPREGIVGRVGVNLGGQGIDLHPQRGCARRHPV